MGLVRLRNCRQRKDIGLQSQQIGVGHIGEGRIWKYWKKMTAIGRFAVTHRPNEIGIAPATDTMCLVG